MVSRVFLILAVALFIADTAAAQAWQRADNRQANWEVGLQTRYSGSLSSDTGNGTSLSIENAWGWGFFFGYNINPKFNVGGAFAWRSAGYRATIVNADDPDSTATYSSMLDTSSIGLTAQWKPLSSAITPYVNGSINWMLINTNIYAGSVPGCWWDPWWGYVCGSYPTTYGANATAGTVGAGGHFELSPGFFLRAGYEYGWTDNSGVGGIHMFRLDIGLIS
jgi:hypothetical protein